MSGSAPDTHRTWKPALELLSKAPDDRPAHAGEVWRRLATWLPERGDPAAALTPWAEVDPLATVDDVEALMSGEEPLETGDKTRAELEGYQRGMAYISCPAPCPPWCSPARP